MWRAVGSDITMTAGDWGVALPVTVSGTTLTATDTLRFIFLDAPNGNEILVKEFLNIVNNTVNLEFTEAESALFPPKSYVYRLDWFQNGAFMCNLIPQASFRVVSKA